MSAPEACPTDETLASLVDGRVAAQRRAGLVDHLDVCPRCREIATTAAELAGEIGIDAARAPIGRHVWAAAAAAVLLVGMLVWNAVLGPGELPSTSVYVARVVVDTAAGPLPDEPAGGRYAFSAPGGPDAAAFHGGRALVRLRAALALEDRAAVAREARRSSRLLAAVESTAELAVEHGRLADAARGGRSLARFEDLPRRSAAALDGSPRGSLATLGAWTEATRIALAAGDDSSLLDLVPVRRRLEGSGLPAAVSGVLDEIEVVARGREISGGDRDRVRDLLDDLVELM